ncbi:MAG: hypothetical protein NC089_09955 [Bacteroides sp.]|nr:hypothetical protein [Bacteroides sp.]MCM1549158.1 hypothetical protein [Clostridium sp.]
MNGVFISDFLKLDNKLEEHGVFDALIDRDSHFFINVLRLKQAQTPEFAGSYERINDFFGKIMILLQNSNQKNDKLYRNALERFRFSEVNGINLGFSESSMGAGFGKVLSKQVISDAYDIVKTGSNQPEIFQLVGLFEENVGADRLSDMIATIILPDIMAYTKRINLALGIEPENYPEVEFINDVVVNPYKKCELLYLPEEILHELPIARCWNDIDRVIAENRIIRKEVNEVIGNKWGKLASSEKKAYLKEYIFKDSERCAHVIEGYKNEEIGRFSPASDIEYFIATIFKQMKRSGAFNFLEHSDHSGFGSWEVSLKVLDIFKFWVEDNKGWDIILSAPSAKREKTVQGLIQLSGLKYCEDNNFDFTFEPNEGPGPADIKISRGAKDKTIIEVKLNTNPDYLHGYEEQIETYAKAEKTNKCIYVYVKIEKHPQKDKKIKHAYLRKQKLGGIVPYLYIIDAQKKLSASRKE